MIILFVTSGKKTRLSKGWHCPQVLSSTQLRDFITARLLDQKAARTLQYNNLTIIEQGDVGSTKEDTSIALYVFMKFLWTGNWTQSISTCKPGWSFSNILTRRNHTEGWSSRRIYDDERARPRDCIKLTYWWYYTLKIIMIIQK